MEKQMHHLLFWVLGLIAVLVAISLLSGVLRTTETAPLPETFVPGPPSQEVLEQLSQSRGFEVLVSYTDRGFEPASFVIKKGESARFTNNSTRDVWIASDGAIYPGTGDCGSPLDSCKPLKPRDFWEFTFSEAGVWQFKNNLNATEFGSVIVRSEQ